jgi:transcriptional regulator with XRE-family HTH domain
MPGNSGLGPGLFFGSSVAFMAHYCNNCKLYSDKLGTLVTMRKKNSKKSDTFAKRLKSLMITRQLTQQKVADAAGVSRTAVVKWLRGSMPGASELFDVATANGVPTEWFFEVPYKDLPDEVAAEMPKRQENDLTGAETRIISVEVKAQLPNLLERLNRATEETGTMSALADYLGVPLASVSRWLSGKRKPGGEITLKMLRWVEKQERQQ